MASKLERAMRRGTIWLRCCVASVALITPAAAYGVKAVRQTGPATPPRPTGIGVRLTLEGPVFTDARGRTLYFGEGSACGNKHVADILPTSGGGSNWKQPIRLSLPLTCDQKTPPLLANRDARP